MPDKKVITVVGATGRQASGLVDSILSDRDGPFACRAITRDPAKPKAEELARRGAEVRKADVDDVAGLTRAFEGAHGVYGLTNFWEHLSAEKETAQARNIAEAARVARVRHVIWSTLEDSRELMPPDDKRMPMLQGKYRIPHFDAKAEADRYFADLPVTYLVTTFYWDNLWAFGAGPKKGEDGRLTWVFPMGESRIAGIAAEDIGKIAYAIFKDGERYIGKRIGVYGEALTIREMAQKLEKGLGVGPITYVPVEPDAYRKFGFPGADEAGNMYQFFRDFEKEYIAKRSADVARSLNPELQTFDQFITRNRENLMTLFE